ncbi:hypothetical protein L6Q79_00675 [bacterium]|nr:hypothetical protein [bacterium]
MLARERHACAGTTRFRGNDMLSRAWQREVIRIVSPAYAGVYVTTGLALWLTNLFLLRRFPLSRERHAFAGTTRFRGNDMLARAWPREVIRIVSPAYAGV